MKEIRQKDVWPERLHQPFWVATSVEELSGPGGGVVTLPRHLVWNRPSTFDLDDRCDLIEAYDRVLVAGSAEDVRTLVNAALLGDVLGDLHVGRIVREEWAEVLRR